MAYSLQLVSGVSDVLIDFLAADSPYRITAWTPAVGQHRAGDGGIEDVVERMTVSIRSNAPYQATQALVAAMQQATAWANGEDVPPVSLNCKLYNSSETMFSRITGPSGNAPMVALPPGYNVATATNHIDGVVLTFMREGVWLYWAPVPGIPPTPGSNNPLVASMSFRWGDSTAPAPYSLALSSTSAFIPFKSYVLIASGETAAAAEERLFIVNAEALASGGYTTQSDADALNGSVLKATTGTVAQTSLYDISSMTTAKSEQWALFINAKTSNSITKYQTTIWLRSQRGSFQTRSFIIDNQQQWRYVGNVSVNGKCIGIGMGNASRLSGSGDMHIDSIALLATTGGTGRAVYISDNQAAETVVLNDVGVYYRNPRVTAAAVGSFDYYDINLFRGDPLLSLPAGHDAIAVSFLINQRHAGGTRWRSINQDGNVTKLRLSGLFVTAGHFALE